MKNDLDAVTLRDRLSYNPETGEFRWLVGPRLGMVAGCSSGSTGYTHIKINQYQYLAHRLAWLHFYGRWPEGEVDHRDRCRSNNAISNLREATPSQNRANAGIRSNNTSGFKGVCYDRRRQKYRADIRLAGRQKSLGYFESAEAASAAYLVAAEQAFGEFAVVAAREILRAAQ